MRKQFLIFSTVLGGCLLGSCGVTMHRVPPGQSLKVALAQKALPVEQPAASSPENSPAAPRLMAIGPALPASDTEQASELLARANFCMQSGHPQEAITAYEQLVLLKPNFAEARYNLAVLYQQAGDEKRAAEEFRKFKETAAQR